MDWVWQSESWLSGWTLPAGSALVALGLTTLLAALYARWRLRVRHGSSAPGETVDLRDEVSSVSPERQTPVGLEDEIVRLERGLAELRRRLETWSPEVSSAAAKGGGVSGGGTLRTIRGSDGREHRGSPEVEALRAFVAESR